MTGGLLQLAAVNEEDAPIITRPTIHMFSAAYKKHTPFARELVEERFVGNMDFGETFTTILSKVGDLVDGLYLKVVLPEASFPRSHAASPSQGAQARERVAALVALQRSFKAFLVKSYDVVVAALQLLDTQGASFADVKDAMTAKAAAINYNVALTEIQDLRLVTTRPLFRLLASATANATGNTVVIYQAVDVVGMFAVAFGAGGGTLTAVRDFLDKYNHQVRLLDRIIVEELADARALLAQLEATTDPFAWVAELGHQMINEASVDIGGVTIDAIDKHDLALDADLRHGPAQASLYGRMIGDDPELTAVTTAKKPSRTLIIPLPFWFCRGSGNALPVVFLRYHDVRINVTLENLYKCGYFTDEAAQALALADVSLLVSYVFVSQSERELFGNNKHEYVITRHHRAVKSDIASDKVVFELPFMNAVRELRWALLNGRNQRNGRQMDYSGDVWFRVSGVRGTEAGRAVLVLDAAPPASTTQVRVTGTLNYNGLRRVLAINGSEVTLDAPFVAAEMSGLCAAGPVVAPSPILRASLELNGHMRFGQRDAAAFGLVQPFQHHTATPRNGAMLYSFALRPNDAQPSGFCNFTPFKLKVLHVDLDETYVAEAMDRGESLSLRVHAVSYNLLAFEYGRAVLSFNA